MHILQTAGKTELIHKAEPALHRRRNPDFQQLYKKVLKMTSNPGIIHIKHPYISTKWLKWKSLNLNYWRGTWEHSQTADGSVNLCNRLENCLAGSDMVEYAHVLWRGNSAPRETTLLRMMSRAGLPTPSRVFEAAVQGTWGHANF